jgi:endogenous inhibitor of DNA gyrase (YacG/DUF329 family)
VSRTCPICGKPAVVNHLPFCSARCADVDLNRWLKESYAIPAVEADDEDAAEGALEDEPGPAGRMH